MLRLGLLFQHNHGKPMQLPHCLETLGPNLPSCICLLGGSFCVWTIVRLNYLYIWAAIILDFTNHLVHGLSGVNSSLPHPPTTTHTHTYTQGKSFDTTRVIQTCSLSSFSSAQGPKYFHGLWNFWFLCTVPTRMPPPFLSWFDDLSSIAMFPFSFNNDYDNCSW